MALLINPALGWKPTDIIEIFRDTENSCFGVWQIRQTIFIGLYLPPSLSAEKADEFVQTAIDKVPLNRRDWPIIISGDINANFAHLNRHNDDIRGATIKETLNQHGIRLVEPNRAPGHFNTKRPHGADDLRKNGWRKKIRQR